MQSTLPLQIGTTRDKDLLQTLPGRVVLAIAASAFVALCARLTVPLWFTPVPLTFQNFAVILVGLALGPVTGCAAMLLYLAEGAIGIPVFNPHGLGGVAQLLGPTGGYLFSYPLAAAAAGYVTRIIPASVSRFVAALAGGVAASLFIFTMGAGWLAWSHHLGASAAFMLGVAPFLPGEVVKITAAAGIWNTLRRWRRS